MALDIQENSTNENFKNVLNASLVNAEKDKPKKPPKYSNPRMKQLNSILYDYILPLTFELCPDLTKLNFEITQVALTPRFDFLLIFWSATDDDNQLLALLSKLSTDLRSELTGLRIMNKIPPILFCKDNSVVKVAEIEKLLSIADMGKDEDHIDVEKDLAKNGIEETENFNKKDFYGIDHDLFKSEIILRKSKSKTKKEILIVKK